MSIIDIRYKLNKILGYETIKENAFIECEGLVEELKNLNDNRYLFYKARLHYRRKEFDKARECYLEMIDSSNDVFSGYYGLYILDVFDRNYESAFKDILLCKKYSDNSNLDLSFYITLAKACCDINSCFDEFSNTQYNVVIGKEECSWNNKMQKLYNDAVDCFNNRNYIETAILLKKFNKIDHSVNTYYESGVLLKCINNLIDLLGKKYLESVLVNGSSSLSSDADIKQLVNFMQMITFDEFPLVERVFYNYYDLIKNNTSDVIFQYMENRISERRKFLNFDFEIRHEYNKIMSDIKKAKKEKDYNKIIELSILGKELFNIPIFDYYQGQAYFRMNMYDESIDKLREYLETGSVKAIKARGYLSIAYMSTNNYEQASLVEEEIKQLDDYFLKLNRKKIYAEKNKYEKLVNTNDISSDIDKFMDVELSIDEFYSYSFPKKVALVRQLYTSNMKKLGDKFMKEIESNPCTDLEKKVISKEKQNKKLYITKCKFGQK